MAATGWCFEADRVTGPKYPSPSDNVGDGEITRGVSGIAAFLDEPVLAAAAAMCMKEKRGECALSAWRGSAGERSRPELMRCRVGGQQSLDEGACKAMVTTGRREECHRGAMDGGEGVVGARPRPRESWRSRCRASEWQSQRPCVGCGAYAGWMLCTVG